MEYVALAFVLLLLGLGVRFRVILLTFAVAFGLFLFGPHPTDLGISDRTYIFVLPALSLALASLIARLNPPRTVV